MVPRPSCPVEDLNKNIGCPASPKRTVEDALSPPKSESAVPVALVFTPKFDVGVNGKVPEPPHALPVFEMPPMELKVAQPAVPPAFEMMRAVVEAVEETERLVVVAFVVLRFVAKMFVLVALVVVAVRLVRLKMVEDAVDRRPPLKVRSVFVAFEGKRKPKFA